ncbi:hypothetical protein Micbo1qcDRAFT_161571 [Microdochium bolleyi]|uniref:tRNA-intron lyase n=1 Tax=Microdochium bolleyi TaxID=196109 RepID=A0A136J919_9PEZI|nr:hypothetical protein Micbo1qcDRAFT_161571 [Microdochium bolleyi]
MPEPPAVASNGHPPVPSAVPSSNDAGVPDVKKNQTTNSNKSNGPPRKSNSGAAKKTPLHQIYTLPAPVRTFPLPSFYPSNPLSLFHVLYAWLSQTFISPPPREPAVVHKGVWSAETLSVHIVDQQAIRALWEQGFFGKGTYSRSEPNWLKREQVRRGENAGHVAENFTAQRRRERNQMKWERARKEQEAIQRTRMREAWVAPVGPMELLALPNSAYDLGMLYNSDALHVAEDAGVDDDNSARPQTPLTLETTSETAPRLQKSVRFSPKVEANTYNHGDPPSPGAGPNTNTKGQPTNGSLSAPAKLSEEKTASQSSARTPSTKQEARTPSHPSVTSPADDIKDIEHLQLAPEEAFYLSFALGVLEIVDPATSKPIPPREQFAMFRRISSQPRRAPSLSKPSLSGSTSLSSSALATLAPDDPFLLQYAAYHHFRSLGWVVRPGIKFGVDWLLYHRGPVFSHAEFAVLVLPAYTHPWWRGAEGRRRKNDDGGGVGDGQMQRRSWHWLHCANRVQAKALKTLVLVYVDVPPPRSAQLVRGAGLDEIDGVDDVPEAAEGGESITGVLGRYKIREFMVKRWLSNRNRD